MDIITVLGIIERLGVIANRAEATSLIGLLEDCSSSILRGIDFKGIWAIGVGLLEDWIAQDNLLKPLNGCHAVGGPDEGYILLCEFGQRLSDVGKASDKWALVAEHTECAMNLLHSGQLFWPGGQAVMFGQINTDCAIADDNA
jgi:hypothetical protein